MEFGEPGLDLRPEEAISTSTSTRTLLASPGVADPGDGHGVADWRAVAFSSSIRQLD